MDTLRPDSWSEFVGQAALRRELQVRIEAANASYRPLDPLLLVGPKGFGKTSLAAIVAKELEAEFESYIMPLQGSTLANVVRQFDGVLLLDEIHRASAKQQEELMPLLEFGYLQGSNGTRIYAGWLTVVGATTEPHKLIAPLYDKFVIKPEFDPYSDEEMGIIVTGMALKAGVHLDPGVAVALGQAAAGTPRNARGLVLAARDLEAVNGTKPTAQEVLELCRVDSSGLSVQHIRYIETLSALGGKAGVKTLSNLLRLNESVVTDLERLLVTDKYVELTDRGRVLLRKGHKLLKSREEN